MILEQALLHVRAGQEGAFLDAFDEAKTIITSARGCIGVDLSRCLEEQSVFLLLVRWETLEDHTVGFRESRAFEEWRTLLHHFYDPRPEVRHFTQIASA